jgi:hypothetical protein
MKKMNRPRGGSHRRRHATAAVKVPGSAANGHVWSPHEYELELKKAKRIGLTKLPNQALLQFCKGAYNFGVHYWHQLRPFLAEVWQRIKERRIPGVLTKTRACQLMGISLRRAQEILAEGAENQQESATTLPLDRQITVDIEDFADLKLGPLMTHEHWGRYQKLNLRLAASCHRESQFSSPDEGET